MKENTTHRTEQHSTHSRIRRAKVMSADEVGSKVRFHALELWFYEWEHAMCKTFDAFIHVQIACINKNEAAR